MGEETNPVKPFWRWVFSEDGNPSLSRTATGLLVTCAVAWVSVIVWRTNALPDFSGLTLFIGALYGINKAAATVAALKS